MQQKQQISGQTAAPRDSALEAEIAAAIDPWLAHMRWRKDFAADRNVRPARFYRMWNEVPTLLMIVIVFLVVLKPF